MCSCDDDEIDIVEELGLNKSVANKSTIFDRAIKEIESLRAQIIWCRKQITTADKNFSELNSNFSKVKAEWQEYKDKMRDLFLQLESENESLARDYALAICQRDEARREVCGYSYDDPRGVARDRGWDCYKNYINYKENTNG